MTPRTSDSYRAPADRLAQTLMALACSLAVTASPATQTVPTDMPISAPFWTSPASVTTSASASTVASGSGDVQRDQLAWARIVHVEVESARRILSVLRNLTVSGSEVYLTKLNQILDGPISVERLPVVAAALAEAREHLESDLDTFEQWSHVRRAIDPEPTGSWDVPARFVAWTSSEEEPWPMVTAADIRVDRTVREFFGEHAHPTPHRA